MTKIMYLDKDKRLLGVNIWEPLLNNINWGTLMVVVLYFKKIF